MNVSLLALFPAGLYRERVRKFATSADVTFFSQVIIKMQYKALSVSEVVS